MTNTYFVRIEVFYLICEASKWNLYNQKHRDEAKNNGSKQIAIKWLYQLHKHIR